MFLLIVLSALSCKKDTAENITANNWVLETSTINPAYTVNQKTSTDYKNIYGSGSCYASNFTYSFLDSGIYTVSSNGALCDMVANTNDQKWTRIGDTITLTSGYGTESMKISENRITQTSSFDDKGVHYTVVSIFAPVKK